MSFLNATRSIFDSILEAPQRSAHDAGDSVDRKTRVQAGVIDAALVLAVLLPLFLVLWMIGLAPTGIIGGVVATVVSAVSFLVINYKLLDANGQTVGKKIKEIKVVCHEGFPVATDDLIIKRYLPMFALGLLPYIGPLLVIGNFLLVLRDNQLCGHDEIAKTKVVKA